MINSLQSLRAIFSVMIFLTHYKIGESVLFELGGDIGVAFFFILSGFFFYYSQEQGVKYGGVKGFVLRLSKLYPLHLLLFVACVIIYQQGDFRIDILNLLLLQSWAPDTNIHFSLNAVSWYLSSLLFCYAMGGIILMLLWRYPRQFIIAFIVVMLIYVTIYLPYIQWCSDLSELSINYWTCIFPCVRLLDFCFGIILCRILTNIKKLWFTAKYHNVRKFIQWAIELNILGVFILFVLTANVIPQAYVSGVWWWLPISLLLFKAYVLVDWTGPLSYLENMPIIIKFGNISYSFYMLHYVIIEVFAPVLDKFSISVESPILLLVITFTVTILVAYFMENFYVKPIAKYLKRLLYRSA